MMKSDWTVKGLLLAIVLLLGTLTFRQQPVFAQTRFDYIRVVSAVFLYKGDQGLLLLDERTGNVWFMARAGDAYKDPVFLIRIPFEKIPLEPPAR